MRLLEVRSARGSDLAVWGQCVDDRAVCRVGSGAGLRALADRGVGELVRDWPPSDMAQQNLETLQVTPAD